MENNFWITEINVKESITFQNEGKLFMRHLQRNKTEATDNRNKVKHIILRRNFVCGTSPKCTKGVKQRKCGHFLGSSQFYWYWFFSAIGFILLEK